MPYACLFTNSRGPWLGAMIGLGSLVYFRRLKKVFLACYCAGHCAVLILGVNALTQGKRNSIMSGIEKAKDWRMTRTAVNGY